MDKATHDVLTSADRLGEWEFPSDFVEDLRLEVESLAGELAAIVGRPLDIDRNVQDASFLTDIGLLDDRYYDRNSGIGALCYLFAFRFSNFGRLYTLHGSDWEARLDEFRLGHAHDRIRSRGFVYVPAEELHSPYDGINGAGNPISGEPLTWWIRFFDYI